MSSSGAARIAARFKRLRTAGRGGLGVYVVAGDPTLDDTEAILIALARGGADLIELGFPFSDPVGDGPDIQAASMRAVRGGTTLRAVLEMVARARPHLGEVPVVLMGYANPVMALGAERTVAMAAAAGADGFILVDQPLEEASAFGALCAQAGLANVLIAAPTTGPDRLQAISAASTGFLYVASGGTTGSSEIHLTATAARVEVARSCSQLPVAVGFGISTAAHVAAVTRIADMAIVGTAMVRQIAAARGDAAGQALTCLRALRRGLA